MGSRRRGVTATSAEGTDFPDFPGAIGETGKPARPTRVGDRRILGLALGCSPSSPLGVGYDVFRAFTTRGARRIVMVDSLDKVLTLRSSGVGNTASARGRASNRRASTSAIHLPSWDEPKWPGKR